jgi:hypothetical protein
MNNNNNNKEEEMTKFLVILDPETEEVIEVDVDDQLYDGGFQDPEEDEGVYHITAPDADKAADTAVYLERQGKFD